MHYCRRRTDDLQQKLNALAAERAQIESDLKNMKRMVEQLDCGFMIVLDGNNTLYVSNPVKEKP
jgi:hypothetical protein